MSHWNRILEQASMTRVVATALIVFSVLACLFPRSERQKESDDIVAPAIGKPGDSFGDPRIVSRQPLRVGNEFVVAWITDSSPLIYKIDPVDPVDFTKWEIEGMIQRKILDILPGLDGRRLKFKMYMQYGNRGVDKYFQAQAAISQKPDLLIYGVNPTFDFTTANILGEPMTPGSLATYGDRAAWAWALILSSPADLFQGVLMRLLPAVRDRYDMGEVIAEFRNRMDWFDFGPLRPAPDKGGYSPMWEKGLPEYDKQHVPVSQVWELLAMGQMQVSDQSWGVQLLNDFTARARRSGIPTLIYALPLNLRTIETDAQAFKHYRAFEEWFREFSTRENAGTVHVIPEWPSLKLSELEFADIDHLTFADPFIRYMSEEISKNARVK